MIEEINGCTSKKQKNAGQLAKYVDALINNRYLYRHYLQILPFALEVMEKLRTYSWPGDVRELENVIERAVNLADGPEIRPGHIIRAAAEYGNGLAYL